MDGFYIRKIQELEYQECLRTDIEREIIEYEKAEETMLLKRIRIEETLVEEAEHLDYEMERCTLSPRSLRIKRLEYYENKNYSLSNNSINNIETPLNENEVVCSHVLNQCISLTKKGTRCLKRTRLGMNVCHIHNNLKKSIYEKDKF